MSVLCFLHFFTNLISSSLEITSRICPEFFMFGICPGLSIQNLSRIFHVRNLFGICPEFLYWTISGQILDEAQFYILYLCQKNGQFPDDFRTCKIYSGQFLDILMTFSGHLVFIGYVYILLLEYINIGIK